MELFTKLFGGLLLFVYHCFDRIVNYLSGLSRAEQVEGYFTDGVILGSQGFVESHFLRLKQTLGYRAPQGGDAFNRPGFSWPLGLPRPAGPAGRLGSRRIRVLFTIIAAHSNYEPKSSLNPGLRSGVYQESSSFW